MKNEELRVKNERRNQLREFEELRMKGFSIGLPGRKDGRVFG
jgi:hypothetical protein